MKTLTKLSFFVLSGLLAFTTVRAQTAEDVVNKYVSAIGGRDALNSVKSLLIESSMNAMGTDAPGTITILVGKGYKTEYDFSGSKLITAITPNGGWQVNPYAGAATPTALPDEQLKGQKINLQLDPLANYAANGYKVELTGKDTADYKLKLSGNGVDITYYVNMKTYLVDKLVSTSSMGGQEAQITISFSDYRKIDGGLLYPYATNLDLPQISLVLTSKKVTVNPTIDPTVFEMPK